MSRFEHGHSATGAEECYPHSCDQIFEEKQMSESNERESNGSLSMWQAYCKHIA